MKLLPSAGDNPVLRHGLIEYLLSMITSLLLSSLAIGKPVGGSPSPLEIRDLDILDRQARISSWPWPAKSISAARPRPAASRSRRLSAGVKQLEEQMGVLLVNRGSRFQGFTPEGERVLDWARRIVGDTRAMREEINALRARPVRPAAHRRDPDRAGDGGAR